MSEKVGLRRASGRRSAPHWLSFASLLIALSGCDGRAGREASVVDSRETTAPKSLILSASALDGAFLLARDAPVRWRFAENQFVVESWNQPLPAALLRAMLHQTGAVYRVAGQWTLHEGGRRLHLDDLQADGPEGVPGTDLEIEPGPENTLRIGDHTYDLLDHPGHREVLPNDQFRARLVAVEAGHLITVEHGGQVEPLRLAGAVCPGPDHPLGKRAIQRAEELMRGRWLQVKIYDRSAQIPRRAQVFSSSFYWINLQLIEEGLAWHDKSHDGEWLFSSREDVAREQHLGIWADRSLDPPWWSASP